MILTSGYLTEISYTFGYYAELNPLRIELPFLNAGFHFPEVTRACELGFGQGLSTNIHAAGTGIAWWGTDFNPSHASLAREMAACCNSGAALYDDAFDQFACRSDLPRFDFIGLHGIWSWISDDNKTVLVNFIRDHLKPGGVLYISYNTHPGWSAFAPVRKLFSDHADSLSVPGSGVHDKVRGAVEFTEKLMATNPLYFAANPQSARQIENIKKKDSRYVAHEFFNSHWDCIHFSDMAKWLAPANLSYACSATLLDHIDSVNLTPEQMDFLNGISDINLRESVRDFMVNQRFRRDYWVKGLRRLTPLERIEILKDYPVVLSVHPSDVSLKITGATGGVVTMQEAVYAPILDALSDYAPKTLRQIAENVSDRGINFQQIVQAVVVLTAKGVLHPVQNTVFAKKSRGKVHKLNEYIINTSRYNEDIAFLASPVTGGGINVTSLQQMFLLADRMGHKKPEGWADFAWQILSSRGKKLIKKGKAIESPGENKAELLSMARLFSTKQIPVLKAFQVI